MASFNDLMNQANTKTQNFAEVTRLKSAIKDEERNIQAAFTDIGAKYYELHANDAEPAIQPMAAYVQQAQQRIMGYRSRIRDLSGLIACPTCGAELPLGTPFCSNCGAQIPYVQPAPQAPTQNKVFCPSCGAENPSTSRFCSGCGGKLFND